MRRLRVGVVGCGQIARTAHLPNYARCPDVELVAVADRHRARAELCAREFGGSRAFDSFEAMLEATDLDALSICVPNKFHAPYAIAALERGIHVLCEKPPAMTGDEAAAMAAAARRNGRVLTFGFHYRWGVEVGVVKRFVDAQDLGEIHAARAVALRRRGIPGWGVFNDKALQGGGPLMDIGVHVLDLALWLMGYPKPRVILATTHRGIGSREGVGALGDWDWRNYSVEDMARGMIQFENGASLLLETSFAANVGEQEQIQVSLMGDRGGADVLPPRIYQERHGVLTDTAPVNLAPSGTEACYARQIRDFVQCCREGGRPMVSPDESVALQRIVDALYLSAERRRAVDFEASEEATDRAEDWADQAAAGGSARSGR
jgi:predicted dehydrogenase